MPYKAIEVANWFIDQFDRESGGLITHLKVQKLLYFAEAWCQALLDRELFEESMEAWAHGPVVREVFDVYRDYGWEPLTASDEIIEFDSDVEDVLNQVLDVYGEVSAKTLEKMTHKDKPWLDARGDLGPEERCTSILPKESIKTYFIEKYQLFEDGEA
jgi:uncharacterized phage-associated protein